MGPQQPVTNSHTDSRASLRSAADGSACPRCAAGRYAAGIEDESDGRWEERQQQASRSKTWRISRWEGLRPDVDGLLSAVLAQPGGQRVVGKVSLPSPIDLAVVSLSRVAAFRPSPEKVKRLGIQGAKPGRRPDAGRTA
jgi:hypothetical protein